MSCRLVRSLPRGTKLTACSLLALCSILLVAFGVLLLGDSVSGTQLMGYGIALCGLIAFKTPEKDWLVYVAKAKSLVGR